MLAKLCGSNLRPLSIFAIAAAEITDISGKSSIRNVAKDHAVVAKCFGRVSRILAL
eukprot:CAMPEP_0183456974 /NCGR_PEP_ID=MMETSP0370-20130417/130257_1 /TAXON_ID=268820 /ORGANISM="Peridinium aciculiferum, Strain PAER-2" /LENGTH=55 /DNA_ID=CAMNT_0025648661 /DNA_START=131 /DNA_END=295 /DNA_ORIENTATION=+